jgi:predicted kinase
MSTAILTIGAPASGKSTWARGYAEETGVAIVCRDDIRIMQGLKHGDNEDLVTVVEQALIEGLISEGKDFIVADTNINKKFRSRLIKFCHQRGADVELVVFDVPLDVLISRDNAREAKVGADVIMRMYNDLKGQNLKSESLPVQEYSKYEHGVGENYRPEAIVVDIDGTVARHVNRSPYDYTKVSDDQPIEDVISILRTLVLDYEIIFVSGRDDSCFSDTSQWIVDHVGLDREDFRLHMRKSNDQRPDYIIKNEIYDEHVIPNYNVVMVFDDRDQVVYHLRRRGITVAQVADGRF